jgi:membrane protein DedA with SNARE-associated domain
VWRFTIYTFLGSFVWALGLAAAGYKVGENYEDVRDWMQPVEYPIALLLAAFVAWYVYRHIKEVVAERNEAVDEPRPYPE